MTRRWAAVLALAVLSNLYYNATLPLHFDEAYYWVWSKHLQFSYFDHPPMISWLIRSTAFFGDSEWQIRLVPWTCMSLTGLGIWALARDMFGDAVALKAVLIFLLSPLVQIGFLIATPDAPLILGWTAAIFFAHRAIFYEKPRFYYAAGIAAGFALLSKYTAVLLLPGLLLFYLFSGRRNELRRKEFIAGVVLAGLIFLPVILWNAGHGWSSFRFQLQHGFTEEKMLNLAALAEFIGAQAVVLSPVFFFFLLYILLRKFQTVALDERQAFLLWPCLTVLVFFGYSAIFKRTEGNWAAPAHVTSIILLAKWLDLPRYTWVYRAGIALGILMTMLLKAPEMFDFLPRPMVMKRQMLGNDQLFLTGGQYIDESTIVLAADYKLASLAWYYLPGQPTVHVLTPARFSQFDYWRKDIKIPENSKVVFFASQNEQAAKLTDFFTEVKPLKPLSYQDRYISREIQVFQCRGFNSLPALLSSSPPFH